MPDQNNKSERSGQSDRAESTSDRLVQRVEQRERQESTGNMEDATRRTRIERRAADKQREDGEASTSTIKHFKGKRLGLYDGDRQIIPEDAHAAKDDLSKQVERIERDLIAQGMPKHLLDKGNDKALKDRLDARRDVQRRDIAGHFKNLDALFVHRGREDEHVDYAAAKKGYHLSGLDRYKNVSPDLVAAVLRNEQHWYKATDAQQDAKIAAGQKLTDSASIGPAQLQIGNIKHVIEAKDQHGKPRFPYLQHMADDPLKAAEQKDNAALLAASFLKIIADELTAKGVEVNDKTLSYKWNPDVLSRPLNKLEPGGPREYKSVNHVEKLVGTTIDKTADLLGAQEPQRSHAGYEVEALPKNSDILNASTHVQNVQTQLAIIKRLQSPRK